MPFERFTKKQRRPTVSIWSKGQIGLNQGAVDEIGLQNYKYVIFFYDKEDSRIGLKFTNNEKEEGISKVTMRKESAVIHAKPFLDYYKLTGLTIKKRDIEFDKDNNFYTVKLYI